MLPAPCGRREMRSALHGRSASPPPEATTLHAPALATLMFQRNPTPEAAGHVARMRSRQGTAHGSSSDHGGAASMGPAAPHAAAHEADTVHERAQRATRRNQEQHDCVTGLCSSVQQESLVMMARCCICRWASHRMYCVFFLLAVPT